MPQTKNWQCYNCGWSDDDKPGDPKTEKPACPECKQRQVYSKAEAGAWDKKLALWTART